MSKSSSTTILVVVILAMGVTGAATILSIPPLFEPAGSSGPWLTGTLGVLFVVLSVCARYLRSRHDLADRSAGQ